MLDPLKRLIWAIEDKYKIDELIFIGDYIDYGPSSKEVIDYITGLPHEKTFLAGNHEDLLLQYFNKGLRDEHFTEEYWVYDNEGRHTIRSLTGLPGYGITPEKALAAMDKKYMNFFESLLYSYEKEIDGQKYLFTHSHAGEKRIDEYLRFNRYDTFHKYLLQNDILMYNTPIWQRYNYEHKTVTEYKKVRDFVVIHGHTPVASMNDKPEYVKKYKAPYIEADRIIEAREVKLAEYVGEKNEFEFDIKKEEIYGINIDTGISIGHGLAALGIPVGYKDYPHDDYDKSMYQVVQVRSDAMNKSDYYMRYYTYTLLK